MQIDLYKDLHISIIHVNQCNSWQNETEWKIKTFKKIHLPDSNQITSFFFESLELIFTAFKSL